MNESQKFINLETISAKLLLGATILALCLCNSPLNNYYNNFFHRYFFGYFGTITFKSNLLFIINEGLMSIFFLAVGLEIKYELLRGALNSIRKAALPGIGAIGGMIVPAVIYVCINHHDIIMLRGWAVPTATDIAFSLAILSLLGTRVNPSLKIFLTALAIFDDLAAIIIVAFFYTSHISFIFLGLSFICVLVIFILNRCGITRLLTYTLTGFSLWACLLKSGVNATLAGVILAFMIPMQNKKNSMHSPLRIVQRQLHPWVALIILPLFAFANAGISFSHLDVENMHITMILGVFFGLFVGKQLGIFSVSWLAVKLHIATRPSHMKWNELYAISIICGIGFTISLFIGSLAFGHNYSGYLDSIKIGVLAGSLLSGIVGYLWCLLNK